MFTLIRRTRCYLIQQNHSVPSFSPQQTSKQATSIPNTTSLHNLHSPRTTIIDTPPGLRPQPPSMCYRVYLITSLDTPRNTTSLFVETEDDKSGFTFRVSVDADCGVYVDHVASDRPEDDETFLYKTYVGKVADEDYAQMHEIVAAVPASLKQFDRPDHTYPGIPLRRWSDWAEDALRALREEGILMR
jgi:hypothetical protein